MGGYSKNIAVIKELKQGFSADGGAVTGVVKVELYGMAIRAEVTKINFAPLTEGKYVTGLSDGNATVVFEGDVYEGRAEIDTTNGFAALICYINGQVSPIAAAVSGNYQGEALGIKAYIERLESGAKNDETAADNKYEDEAIAEVNYYEYAQGDESGSYVREDKAQEESGRAAVQNEKTARAVEEARGADGVDGGKGEGSLARGGFYEKMKNEIEGLLSAYPEERGLCSLIEGSKWVKINYGDDKYYVFGVIYSGGNPQYLCYGVPSDGGGEPPESMAGLASFLPSGKKEGGGFWVMYQDAQTGASIKVDSV